MLERMWLATAWVLRAFGCGPRPANAPREFAGGGTSPDVVDVALPPSPDCAPIDQHSSMRVMKALTFAFHKICLYGAFDQSNPTYCLRWPDYMWPAFDAHNVLSSALLLVRVVFPGGYQDSFRSRLVACACLTIAMKASRQTALKFAHRLSENPYEVDTLGAIYMQIFRFWPTVDAAEFRSVELHHQVMRAEGFLLASRSELYSTLFDSAQTHAEQLIWAQNPARCDGMEAWPSPAMLMARNACAFLMVLLHLLPGPPWVRHLPREQLGSGLAYSACSLVLASEGGQRARNGPHDGQSLGRG